MKLVVSPKAEKELSKLPKSEQFKIAKKLALLERQPQAGKKLSGKLADFRSLRSWPYRIIYHFENRRKITWVDHIIHRQNAYN